MSDKFKIKENRRDDLWNVYDASEEVHVNLCNCPDHETAEEICIALNTRAPQAASDSVTISRESLLRASWIVEEYTKDKVFTAHESGMVIEMKAEIKQALKP
jgi:hypothetical protein